MAITLKDYEVPALPSVPQAAHEGALNAELISLIHKQITNASIESIERSQKYIDAVMRDVLQTVEKRLDSIEVPRPQVLAVEVDGEIKKLKSQAAPYLGEMLINAKLGLNTLLVGPAGCGKTMAAHQLAEGLGRQFGQVCLTAGASETWLFGRQTPNGFIEAPFSKLYREGGVFLADEIDAAEANLLLSINTALANGTLYNPISGETSAKHKDFVFVGAANTMGKGADAVYTGRSRLDGATLNRFVIIAVDYIADIERQTCPDKKLYKHLIKVRSKLNKLRSDEIISTRTLDIASKRQAAGIPMDRVLGAIASGWPSDLIEQTGILKFEDEKPKEKIEVIPADAAEEPMTF